jgi:D-3-phosphoglycerate dehydrogenase / 2-oxoglutarate reductase
MPRKSETANPVRIVVPDDYPCYLRGTPAETRLQSLGNVTHHFDSAPKSSEELIARCRDADVVFNVYGKNRFSDAVLGALPKLKMISRSGTGVDGVDLDACRRRGIVVSHLKGNDAQEIAEHAIALMLNALRRIGEMDRSLRQGAWRMDRIRGAHGLTLGVVGLGAIGRRMVALGRALGMNVIVWTFGADDGRAAGLGVPWVELDALLRQSDVVSLHLRLSDDTRNLIDARRFALMKADAVLINTARAGMVDRAAMLDALGNGRIAAAGLDVFHTEPLPADDPLLALPNVVMTPHNGSSITEVMDRGLMTAVENIANFLAGRPSNLAT